MVAVGDIQHVGGGKPFVPVGFCVYLIYGVGCATPVHILFLQVVLSVCKKMYREGTGCGIFPLKLT